MNFLTNIQKWKLFPSVDTLGYFHPLGNFICLNEFKDEKDFEKTLNNPSLDKDRYSVYIHEYQHYLDQISTLWGIKNIYKIYESYDSVFGNEEYKFHKHRELILSLKRDYFLDYYTVKYNDIRGDYKNRWQFRISSGLRFDHNGKVNEQLPIPFLSFASAEGIPISRVPISVVSLLETTATYAEFSFLLNEAIKLSSPYRENQLNQISKKLESKLYHPDLTLYSAAVHLTSVNLKILDPILAYKISSIFAKIALNLPFELFENIPFSDEINSSEEWLKRATNLIQNEDRGFVFYLLIINYLAKRGILIDNRIEVVDILSSSNLPNETEIEDLITKEVQKLDYDLLINHNNFNRRVIDKVFYGNKFRQSTGIGQQNPPIDISQFVREEPYLIFSETYFEYENLDLHTIFMKVIKQFDISIEEWFKIYTHCENKIDEFNEICGI
jgi:hypothetical protein